MAEKLRAARQAADFASDSEKIDGHAGLSDAVGASVRGGDADVRNARIWL